MEIQKIDQSVWNRLYDPTITQSSEKETARLDPGEKEDIADVWDKTAAEGCQTCKSRKYADQSNDPGVSYKAPTKIDPYKAAGAVLAHETEHITRNRAKALAEDKKIVAQSIQIYRSFCPECGRSYISGGQAKTTTAEETEFPLAAAQNQQNAVGQYVDQYV